MPMQAAAHDRSDYYELSVRMHKKLLDKVTLVVANKIDLPEASPATLKAAFPQHPVVPRGPHAPQPPVDTTPATDSIPPA